MASHGGASSDRKDNAIKKQKSKIGEDTRNTKTT